MSIKGQSVAEWLILLKKKIKGMGKSQVMYV